MKGQPMAITTSQVKRFLKRECPDATVEHRRSGHFKLIMPNGKSVIVACSPSDWRAMKNTRAQIKRAMRGDPL
jgi:hypothetical protein